MQKRSKMAVEAIVEQHRGVLVSVGMEALSTLVLHLEGQNPHVVHGANYKTARAIRELVGREVIVTTVIRVEESPMEDGEG